MRNKIVADTHYQALLGEPYDIKAVDAIVDLIDLTVECLKRDNLYGNVPAIDVAEIEDIRKDLMKILEPEVSGS